MVSWKAVCAVLGLLLLPALAPAAENCTACHNVAVSGVHQRTACSACHGDRGQRLADPAAASNGAAGCVACHAGHNGIFLQGMTTRSAEKNFVAQTFSRVDPDFFAKNCSSCHVSSCTDCHGGNGHKLARPALESCHRCHKGYFIGADFFGRAPREDSLRYQRGDLIEGEAYLKMTPDVHFEAGMSCGDCHSMTSLAAGRKTAKSCRDCHTPDLKILEHRIGAHLEKLECYACHSAWGAQEYGTFYLRLEESASKENFRLRGNSGSEYLKSAYLKRQNAPPLGLNNAGRVSPIRPQFITFYTHTSKDQLVGEENQLLAAQWKAFFPHTIRRGTVLCRECHESPQRFLLEKPEARIYLPDVDGLALPSFWNRQGQQLGNGRFFPAERFESMSRHPAYLKGAVEKWNNLIKRVEVSSGD
jgi:hypothetical protein